MGKDQTPHKMQQPSSSSAENRRSERLVAVAIFGFLALNFPMLSVFDLEQLWLGIPVLYWYLFGIWFAFLIAVALIVERRGQAGDTLEHGD